MALGNPMKFFCLVAVVGSCFTVSGVYSESHNSTLMLWSAVERNDPTAVRDALESWANAGWRNGSGFSALHLAAAGGHVAAAGVLLKAGVDRDATTLSGDRPLHLAAANGRDAVVALLIVAGADARSAGNRGETPLIQAIHNGRTSTAALIRALSYNCINGTGVMSSTQPTISFRSQDSVTTEVPLSPTNATQVQRSREAIKEATEALWTAVERNDSAAARSAIMRGADLDARRDYGKNALHEAAAYGHIGLMDVLLKAGIGIESEDRDGDRPLHWAARRGTSEAVTWLVKAGADLRSRGEEDRTPVEVADIADNTDTKATLINLGALL